MLKPGGDRVLPGPHGHASHGPRSSIHRPSAAAGNPGQVDPGERPGPEPVENGTSMKNDDKMLRLS